MLTSLLFFFFSFSFYTFFFFFFFNDTATTEIYTLSLHDALPILFCEEAGEGGGGKGEGYVRDEFLAECSARSEEHTSELQSQSNLVCRLLLEKKKKKKRRKMRCDEHKVYKL